METAQEHEFECPYCGEEISMVLDTSVEGQQYVEDCQVCCNPIDITYETQEGVVTSFFAKQSDE